LFPSKTGLIGIMTESKIDGNLLNLEAFREIS
jgi:hypothetical protein